MAGQEPCATGVKVAETPLVKDTVKLPSGFTLTTSFEAPVPRRKAKSGRITLEHDGGESGVIDALSYATSMVKLPSVAVATLSLNSNPHETSVVPSTEGVSTKITNSKATAALEVDVSVLVVVSVVTETHPLAQATFVGSIEAKEIP